MKFWDTSAIVSLFVREPFTPEARANLRSDPVMVVWWGTRVECRSAVERRRREGSLAPGAASRANRRINQVLDRAAEVAPDAAIRADAERLLGTYPLRAADALQLAAALTWASHRPAAHGLVCLDARLRAAAQAEGFALLPTTL